MMKQRHKILIFSPEIPITLQNLLHCRISHPAIDTDHGLRNLMADHISLCINIHQTAEGQSVFSLIQGTDSIRQSSGKHRNHPVYQIYACSPSKCLTIKSTSSLYIIAYIRNMHTEMINISILCQRDSIIQIFRIFTINRNNSPVPQIHPSLKISFNHMIRYSIRLIGYFYRKIHWQFICSRNGKHIYARGSLSSQNFLYSSLRIFVFPTVRSNLCHNFVTIICPKRMFPRNKDVLLNLLIIRNHKSIVFTFLKCTNYFRDSMSKNLYNRSFPALTGSFFFHFHLYPILMKSAHSIILGNIQIFFLIFQFISLRLRKLPFLRVMVGILYTYLGLVLFLTGVNVGFSSLGAELGAALAEGDRSWLLIPLAALLGWFIISAEPAVGVLEKQIEDVSAGAIPGKTIKASLSVAIALAMAFSMLRVVTGISLLWFIVPGYALALILSFFVPDIYTAIAFDSGGVASGPMTATFMLQFMMGTSIALGGDVLCDAFGVVALVAMMPLLSIQAVGFYYEHIAKRPQEEAAVYGDYDIIELWEASA